ncbi:hypothetical protein [Limosilactobacillus sp.]|uniref:hypothetical protein n=1 Tax=Limosilactobacillus sp. TaxID=2773925 RepID=UPI00345E6373
MNPPLRSREDQEACLAGLLDGTIDCVPPTTLRTPTPRSTGSFWPRRIVGSETAFALLYAYVKNGIFTLAQLIDWLSGAPKRVFKLEDAGLAIGDPADIAVLTLTTRPRSCPTSSSLRGTTPPSSVIGSTGRV